MDRELRETYPSLLYFKRVHHKFSRRAVIRSRHRALWQLYPSPTLVRQSLPTFPLYLVLDGVSDPGNVGTLLRSSVAVGAAGVVRVARSVAMCGRPKAVRSAMGCTFQIPITTVDSWSDAQQVLLRESTFMRPPWRR